MTRKQTPIVEKMHEFRDKLDSYYVKGEKEGFEYPDIEGDDTFFKGSEGTYPFGAILSPNTQIDEYMFLFGPIRKTTGYR